MSVRIPLRVLEAALKRVIVEQDEAPAQPTKQEIFAKQLEQLNSAKEGETIAAQDKKFVKRGGDWYIADVQLSQDALLSLVNDESYEDIEKKIRRGATSITIKGEQFIGGGTQKAATFVKDRTGVWEDQTPVPPQIVAQYIVLPDESAPFEADVSGVGGEKQWVYKQDELMVVLTDQNMYVMASSGNTDDPLGATYNLLAKTGVLSNFMDVGAARKGFGLGGKKTNAEQISAERASLKKFLTVGSLDETSPDFYNVPLSNLNMGDLTTAIAKARTFGAKVFDLFTADNIKMNFTMTKFGPALVRSLVVGGRKGERGSGGMSDNDIRTLQATQLFREEALPTAGGGKYTVNLDPKTQNLVEAVDTNTPPKPTKADLEVTPIGGVNFNPGVKFVPAIDGGTAASGYSDAFLLYTKGIASKGVVEQRAEVPADPPAAPAPDPAIPDPDPGASIVTVPGSAIMFKFNSDEIIDDSDTPLGKITREYVDGLARDLTNRKAVAERMGITIVATASVEGNVEKNQSLANQRASAAEKFLSKKLGTDNYPGAIRSYTVIAGERPFNNQPANPRSDGSDTEHQRFVKYYWGTIDDNNKKMAQDVRTTADQIKQRLAGTTITVLEEVRRHIRRILLESMRRG